MLLSEVYKVPVEASLAVIATAIGLSVIASLLRPPERDLEHVAEHVQPALPSAIDADQVSRLQA
jgi:hypothetical protein